IPHGDGTPDGVFAEWKWDGRRLRVRNDRYGVHPLFYYATANEIAVSTSVARLLAGGAPADFDGDAIAVFLRLGFFVGEDTPFHTAFSISRQIAPASNCGRTGRRTSAPTSMRGTCT